MKPSSVKHNLLRLIILFILLINNCGIYSQNKESSQQQSSQLTDVLNYKAKDSIVLDMENNKSFLYNEAHIDYGEISLDACFIEFDLKTKIVIARFCLDSNNKKIGIPVIKDGETATTSDSLKYNFETQKGITYHVKLKEGESYIHGEKVKKQTNGDIHIRNALYTTCDLDHPHFYFKLSKAIIKPDDKIVSGPVNLFIADIPTPLGLPFAFLPNKKNKSSNGLIVPTYGESAALGFYLLGGGYYHQFKSGKFSTSLTGDIYSKGSWGISNRTQYKTRYKYSGQFTLNYRNTIQGEKGFEDYNKSKDFFVKWNHQNDAKLNPGTTFRALINAGTTTNFRNDYNNISANNYLTNTFNSNISWSKQFKGKISSNLNGNLRHSQNSNTGMMTFTLPEIAYNVNRFYPLKMLRKTTISKNFIHEFINQTNVNYQLNTKNEINELSEDIKLDNLNNMLVNSRKGIRHNINASSSIKLFGKNVTINPAYQLSSLWYFDQINKSWNATNQEVQNDTVRNFSTIYSHSFSASATSKIYGFYQPAKFLRGKHEMKIRHTITPNVNFSYKPSTYSLDIYQNDSTGTNFTNYSPYSNNIYGTVSSNESGRIGFSLINSLELKRKNLNLSIIIDRSGSMAGHPLEEAKRCAITMVEGLEKDDRVSIVQYDSRAQLLIPSTLVSGKYEIQSAIKQIDSGGATDLFGGWSIGAREVSRHINDKSVNRVLLLSDGNANNGLTDSQAIQRECERSADRVQIERESSAYRDPIDRPARGRDPGDDGAVVRLRQRVPDEFVGGRVQGAARARVEVGAAATRSGYDEGIILIYVRKAVR